MGSEYDRHLLTQSLVAPVFLALGLVRRSWIHSLSRLLRRMTE